jgi:hypothetical protein
MPTMEEIEQSLLASLKVYGPGPSTGEESGWTNEQVVGQHELVHIRFGPGYLDCKSSLLLEAWAQVKKTVDLCAAKIEDPKDHRAEAFLLMLFQEMYYHGYTPKRS